MINTKELEKRWYKYKTKSFLLLFSIIAIVILLIYGGYYILYKLDLNMDKKEITKPTAVMSAIKRVKDKNITINKPMPIPTIVKEVIEKVEDKQSDIVSLSPTIPIIDLDSEKAKDITKEKVHLHKKAVKRKETYRKKHIEKRKKLIRAKEADYLTAKELSTKKHKILIKQDKKKIDFKRTTSNYMNIMKEKFNENKNPREALLIAKAYYRAGNYKKSEEWALKANNLDKNIEESWLLFAKSKDALGKKKEALKILIAYYNQTKSAKVKLLIEKISSKSI